MFCRTLALIMAWISLGWTAHAESDNQLWTSAAVQAQVAAMLKADAGILARYDQNATEVERLMPEVKMTLGPVEWLELGAGVRAMSVRSKSGDREPINRRHAFVGLEHDVGPVEVGYRLQYQSKHELDEEELVNRLRNRVMLQLDTDSSFKPLIAAELFTDPNATPVEQKKLRLSAGSRIKITRSHRLKLRLHHQSSLDGDDETERILCVDYTFRFPKK